MVKTKGEERRRFRKKERGGLRSEKKRGKEKRSGLGLEKRGKERRQERDVREGKNNSILFL